MKHELTTTEIEHIITLLDKSERSGEYYGNKAHYFNRAKSIRKKLKLLLPDVSGSLPDECVYANVLPHKPGYVCLNQNHCEKCRAMILTE